MNGGLAVEKSDNIKALFVVVNAGLADEVMCIAREAGVHGATIWNVRGESAHYKSVMGMTLDTEREIILSVTTEDTAERAMAAIKEKAGINSHAHSICFTMSIERLVGLNIPGK
jgi:nitrogen regulatory protein PII